MLVSISENSNYVFFVYFWQRYLLSIVKKKKLVQEINENDKTTDRIGNVSLPEIVKKKFVKSKIYSHESQSDR